MTTITTNEACEIFQRLSFHASGSNDFRSKQNQLYENKLSPPSSTHAGGSNASQKVANPRLPPQHKCTDPESCRRQMKEDFENDRPLWKLTCYGHVEYGPCDIVGEKSYEEMRALAYGGAKSGLCLEPIVARERSSVLAKVLQFNSLLISREHWMRPRASILAPPSSVSGTVTITSESKVAELNTFHTSGIMPPVTNLANSQSSTFPNGLNAASFEMMGSNASQNLIAEMPKGNAGGCNSIWFKEEWFPGEIPEAAPPDEFIHRIKT